MRVIYRVDAWLIDANGAYHGVDGYPKNFDSNNYSSADEPAEVAYKRADGDASDIWADMCKNDTRMIQTVTVSDINGNLIYRKTMGSFPVVPENS